MVKLDRSFQINWWQAAIYETAMVSGGVVLGVYFTEVLRPAFWEFLIIFLAGGIYIYYAVWWRQVRENAGEEKKGGCCQPHKEEIIDENNA